MKKIALVKTPGTYADWYRRPVLGLSYLAACAEQRGSECRIFDAYFSRWSLSALIDHVVAYGPDLVGVTAMTHEIVQAAQVAAAVKQRLGVPVVVGGCHCTALPPRTLEEFGAFDYGVCGEGEATFVELIETLRAGAPCPDVRAVKGLVCRGPEGIVVTEPRPNLTEEQLDRLPLPAFGQYYAGPDDGRSHKNQWYAMLSTRGCPYQCAFCMQALGRRVRRRSVDSVVGEIEHAVTTYGTRLIDFCDEIFLFKDDRTRAILTALIDSGLSRHVRWTAVTRANLVDREILTLARQAGCIQLGMGVESGDDAILKTIGKGITVQQVRDAVRIVKEVGLPLVTYFIIGHPHETRQSAARTVDLAVELNTKMIAVGLMVPYPGTRVYEMARRREGGYRLLSEDWATYDKYGGRALALENLPYDEMERIQRSAYVKLYLRNGRLLEMLRFLWSRRAAVLYFLRQRLSRRLRRRGLDANDATSR